MEKYGVVVDAPLEKTGAVGQSCPSCGTTLKQENHCEKCGTKPFEKIPKEDKNHGR